MRLKKIAISLSITMLLLISALMIRDSLADTAEIKSTMKIQRMGYYIIVINFETHDAWTDNILFKVYCKFRKGEFTFTSATLNNVSQGWHKTEIGISDVMKKRYGSLREYRVELYCKGIMIDAKDGY